MSDDRSNAKIALNVVAQSVWDMIDRGEWVDYCITSTRRWCGFEVKVEIRPVEDKRTTQMFPK